MDFNNFDYEKLTKTLSALVKKYAFASVFSCGKSVLGRDILCIRIGKGKRKIFLNGAHHSLEWITSSLLASYACDYAAALRDETDFCGENILKLYQSATFYIVPMVNPDGVDFVINGIKKNSPAYGVVRGALGGRRKRSRPQPQLRRIFCRGQKNGARNGHFRRKLHALFGRKTVFRA